MGKGKVKKITAWALIFVLSMASFVHMDYIKAEAASEELLANVPQVESAIKYSEYLEEHSGVKAGTETIKQSGADYSSVEGMQVTTEGDVVQTGNSGKISWNFELEKAGMYQVQIEYFPVDNGGSTIEFALNVNGELPYAEASPILLHRTYADESKDYQTQEGNQAFPSQVEVPQWKNVSLKDYRGYFQEPLTFALKEGENTITVKAIKDCMKIKSITIAPVKPLSSYEEYLEECKNVPVMEDAQIKVQAEDASGKTSPSFYPINDRTSPASEPYDPTYIVLNTIGGTAWSSVGDRIEWQVDVPEDGLYKIGLRYRQNEMRGLFAVRSILINGEAPFKEATDLRFPYDSEFKVKNLSSPEGEEYLFYLKKGTNTIALENALGPYADLIYRIEDISDRLNDIYQEIVVITGTTPDTYQDYRLTERLPNMLSQFDEANQLLKGVKEDFITLCAGTNDKTAVLDRINDLLDKILARPSDISKKITSVRDSVTSLGQWVLDITTQPLTLDYILVNGENTELPRAEGTFWQNVKHEFFGFVGSFTNDYNVYTADSEEEKTEEKKGIEVWVTTGRDQMDVIRQLVNESFTTKTGIPVTLKLVNSSVLLTATSVGRGPDAVIQVSSTLPVDFAVRDAAYDLTQFEDFKEVSKRFHKAAIDCFAYDGNYYGLPDQMSFPVLFYRSDILNKYNIPVPSTWEEVISIIPYLQANNMEFYLDRESVLTLGTSAGVGSSKAINTVYLSMLYQNGGELYNEPGNVAMLNSDESLEAFTTWTEFYTRHSFSTTMDFVTRFRLGEVPLAIMDFTNYNRLSVSAPEINGKWSIAKIPGTKTADGKTDYSLPVTTSASVIIKNSVEKHKTEQEAWEFLKWWTSEEIQTDYAREMESILGSSGRYPVANLESFKKVAWKTDILEVLTEELKWLREVRQVPGSYITGRYVENAFYEIVNDQTADPIDIMYEYNTMMTEEIQNKLREFGIATE